MNLDRKRGGIGFDRLASVYPLLETVAFGSVLQRARVTWVDALARSEAVLLVGEGNGRFLQSLLETNQFCRVTCLDASEAMLGKARSLITSEDSERVTFVQADILQTALPAGSFDALATHFLLDCFSRKTLLRLIPELARSLRPFGRWLLADFVEPRGDDCGSELHRLALRMLYSFFRAVCGIEAQRVVEPGNLLRTAGFRETGRKVFLGDWVVSLAWEKVSVPVMPVAGSLEWPSGNQKALTTPRPRALNMSPVSH